MNKINKAVCHHHKAINTYVNNMTRGESRTKEVCVSFVMNMNNVFALHFHSFYTSLNSSQSKAALKAGEYIVDPLIKCIHVPYLHI